MWTPALRLILVAAASITAGWLGSSYLRRREAEAETESPTGTAPMRRDERPIRTLCWCETCHAHMPLEHSCEAAGVRKILADGAVAPLPTLAGDLSAG